MQSFINIRIVQGAKAYFLLEKEAFAVEWSRLWEQCPWTTGFQGYGFCSIWYESYRSRFNPLLVLSRTENGTLNGLLPLAVSSADGGLVVAGAKQAEYQSWICAPEFGDVFPLQAVRLLQREFPQAILTFKYLPPGTPTAWIGAPEVRRTSRVNTHRRPLLRFGDGEEIRKSFKKKSNKSRLNRLKKMGPLTFKRITDLKEFECLLDDIICYFDCRQAAAYDSAPFRDDDLKKSFHLGMMKMPGFLHVTVLKIGDQLAAALLGACGNKEVQLGIIAHNPFLARHSPGKFHILFLAQMLMEQGYEQLDLTPGEDPYKYRFANSTDEVNTLTVFPSPWQRRKEDIRGSVLEAAKMGLKTLGIERKSIKLLIKKLKRIHLVHTPLRFIHRAREWISCGREMRIYSYKTARVPDPGGPRSVRRDALEDLLSYQPAEAWQSRQQFLSTALARIKNGEHIYSHVENDRLVSFGWLIERREKSFIAEVHQEFMFPPNSAVLYDFYTVPSARRRGLYSLCLRTMLHDAAQIPGTEKIFIAVLADDSPCRHVIEKIGFAHECSLFEEVRFGWARRWTAIPKIGETASASVAIA